MGSRPRRARGMGRWETGQRAGRGICRRNTGLTAPCLGCRGTFLLKGSVISGACRARRGRARILFECEIRKRSSRVGGTTVGRRERAGRVPSACGVCYPPYFPPPPLLLGVGRVRSDPHAPGTASCGLRGGRPQAPLLLAASATARGLTGEELWPVRRAPSARRRDSDKRGIPPGFPRVP